MIWVMENGDVNNSFRFLNAQITHLVQLSVYILGMLDIPSGVEEFTASTMSISTYGMAIWWSSTTITFSNVMHTQGGNLVAWVKTSVRFQ